MNSIKTISPALRATDYKAPHCVWEAQVLTPKRTEFGKTMRKKYEAKEINMSRHDMTTMEPRYRIRKLTPRECFRLMGVEDEKIDIIQASGISNSQQYKLAGNSIVEDVLYHLFRKMFCETENESMQPTLF